MSSLETRTATTEELAKVETVDYITAIESKREAVPIVAYVYFLPAQNVFQCELCKATEAVQMPIQVPVFNEQLDRFSLAHQYCNTAGIKPPDNAPTEGTHSGSVWQIWFRYNDLQTWNIAWSLFSKIGDSKHASFQGYATKDEAIDQISCIASSQKNCQFRLQEMLVETTVKYGENTPMTFAEAVDHIHALTDAKKENK